MSDDNLSTTNGGTASEAAPLPPLVQLKALTQLPLRLTEPIIPLIGTTISAHAHDAWSRLKRVFSKRSQSHIIHLKDKLSSLSRGTLPVSEFLLKIKTIADELATLGAPPGDEDLLIYCTRDLGPAYKEVIVALRTRDTPVSFEELYDKLIDHETYLTDSEVVSTPAALAINFASNRPPQSVAPAPPSHRRPPPSTAPGLLPLPPSTATSVTRGPPRDNKRGRPRDPIQCQYCRRPGHTADKCWDLFPALRPARPSVNTTRTSHPDASPSASTPWLLDSGASNHVASTLSDLSYHQLYNGPDDVVLGNDTNHEFETSRADKNDDWGAGKKLAGNSGFDRKERGERGSNSGDSQSRADEVDNWASNKSFVPSETRKYEKRGGFGSESSNGGSDSSNWGRRSGGAFDSSRDRKLGFEDSENWGRKREEVSGGTRPKLNLQPRTLPVNEEQKSGIVSDVVKAKGNDPIGNARPREEVLKEKGQDWKEIDVKLEAVKIKEGVSAGGGDGAAAVAKGGFWRRPESNGSSPQSVVKLKSGILRAVKTVEILRSLQSRGNSVEARFGKVGATQLLQNRSASTPLRRDCKHARNVPISGKY